MKIRKLNLFSDFHFQTENENWKSSSDFRFPFSNQKRKLWNSTRTELWNSTRTDSYKCWTCAELREAFTFLMENIYVQFEGMVYQQAVGIPMGTNCAPLIADLFLFCYERDLYLTFTNQNSMTL